MAISMRRFKAREGCANDPHVKVAVCVRYSPREVCMVRETTYTGSAMRKHGGDLQLHKDHEVGFYDAMAHRKVAPMGDHGLVIRHRKEAKSV